MDGAARPQGELRLTCQPLPNAPRAAHRRTFPSEALVAFFSLFQAYPFFRVSTGRIELTPPATKLVRWRLRVRLTLEGQMSKKHQPFRMVWHLWLSPDFSRVLAGLDARPFVDHQEVDFQRLLDVLAHEFRYGEPVRIRVANDTVDQVTCHFRMARGDMLGMRCSDFAKMLLEEAHHDPATDVIDISRFWLSLHEIKHRRRAPPPVLIPFVVEGDDYEAVVIWSQQARMALGVRAASPISILQGHARPNYADQEGRLTQGLHEALHALFGVAYEPYALLDEGASDPKPQWAIDALKSTRL